MPASLAKLPPAFPFTAVVGQASLKMALLLAVIEPRLGGVLLSGPRGIAKTTLARALAQLLPFQQGGAFVELPLGCSIAQLTGSLDIDSALSEQKVIFRPGLLAKANNGILYVDEINLLPDMLVDQLLDAAATGRHRVERDGISRVHPARFVLIGSMNPEEGELRPQLSDRFGLAVQLDDALSCEERVAIVRARRQYDADPEGFCERHADAMLALTRELAQARLRRTNIHFPESLEYAIAERCTAAGTEGVRADVAWQRAAHAHAALHQRMAVTEDDIMAVETFVLAHRRGAMSDPTSPPTPSSSPLFMPPAPFGTPLSDNLFTTSKSASMSLSEGESGDAQPSTPSETAGSSRKAHKHVLRSKMHSSALPIPSLTTRGEKQRYSTNEYDHGQGAQNADDIDWERSFSLAENLSPDGLKKVLRHTLQPTSHDAVLIMLDASASQRQQEAFAQTRQVVQGLIAQAHQEQRYVALLYFQGDSVKWLLRGKRGIRNVTRPLGSLHPGGGTPLTLALQESRRWITRWQRRFPTAHIDSWLITDGRCTWDSLTPWPSPLTVVDSEVGESRLKRSYLLAEQLGGTCVSATYMQGTDVGEA